MVLLFCLGISGLGHAAPITLEPNFKGGATPPAGEPARSLCLSFPPGQCKPGVETAQNPGFSVTGDPFGAVKNDSGFTIKDIVLRIISPADANWGDADDPPDGKNSSGNVLTNPPVISGGGKVITLTGAGASTIKPNDLVDFDIKYKGGPGLVRVKASFSVVPEPATLLLVGTSAAGMGLAAWNRRRRARQP
jgi:hypothetical protein